VVPVGSRVRGRVGLHAIEPTATGSKLTFSVTVEIEGRDRPALVAENVVLFNLK